MIISATSLFQTKAAVIYTLFLTFLGGGPNTPNTPGSIHDGPAGFPIPSPKTMTDSCSSNPNGPGSNAGPGSNKKFPAQSPGPRTPNEPAGAGPCGGGSRFPMPSPQSQQGMPGGQGGGPRFPGPMPNSDNPMGGNPSDSNMPLNPSGPPGNKSGGPGPGGPPFDPISSLAQMSQQLQASSSGGKIFDLFLMSA